MKDEDPHKQITHRFQSDTKKGGGRQFLNYHSLKDLKNDYIQKTKHDFLEIRQSKNKNVFLKLKNMIAIIKYFIERLKDRMNKAYAQISNLKEKNWGNQPRSREAHNVRKSSPILTQ